MIRKFRGKALMLADSKMYSPASSVNSSDRRVSHRHCGVSVPILGCRRWKPRRGIERARARHSTCFVYQDQGTHPFIPDSRAQRLNLEDRVRFEELEQLHQLINFFAQANCE